MSAQEYTQKKQMLSAFEALRRNRAYSEEMLPLFQRLFRDSLAGLRNRAVSREKRDEYLEAADLTERLVGFVDERMAALHAELQAVAGELTDLEHESLTE